MGLEGLRTRLLTSFPVYAVGSKQRVVERAEASGGVSSVVVWAVCVTMLVHTRPYPTTADHTQPHSPAPAPNKYAG